MVFRYLSMLWQGSAVYDRNAVSKGWKGLLKNVPARTSILFFIALFIGAFISARWVDNVVFVGQSQKEIRISKAAVHKDSHGNPKSPKKPSWKPPPLKPLTCPSGNQTIVCSSDFPAEYTAVSYPNSSDAVCPEYFRWIHEDLRPWKETGITKEMVERAKTTANFRVVVVKGRVYIEKYKRAFQTRDVFSIWGILQLIRRFPGRIPDFELMFDCVDWPVVNARDYRGVNATAPPPPPLFRYCGDDSTLDIVFPDWSFWGWAEVNIKPWNSLLTDLKEGNRRIKWINRDPTAYWKGNPAVAATRHDLLRCNVSNTQDWNARLYAQDWLSESQQGFKQSNLASQCTHRYKIYIEGSAWSVSEKYILACDSPTLIVKPRYYDFFTRALKPVHHYWPIKDNDKCRSIKFAVDWGNSHKQKAQVIGKAASTFIQEELKMDYVYDYMFHLVSEYSKLLRYKPSKPRKAREVCPKSMACHAKGLENEFMRESMVKFASDEGPCSLPPPFDPPTLQQFLKRKANAIKQVEIWGEKAQSYKQ